MSLLLDNPVQPTLDMRTDTALWQRCTSLSQPAARWRVYLHQLSWHALSAWFQSEFEADVRLWPGPMATAGMAASTAPDLDRWTLWHVVDGLVLTLGKRRIVVMLSEAIDAAELRVPQEWVDAPGWAGDYYMAAQVDVDEQRLSLWGYATFDQLKQHSTYDDSDRTYCLSESVLIQDFSAFWVAQQTPVFTEKLAAAMAERDMINVLAVPLSDSVNHLLPRLVRSPEPRLDIPFVQWCALLQNAECRTQLYQQRQGVSTQAPAIDLGRWATQSVSQLSDTLRDIGWQLLSDLFLPQSAALSFRAGPASESALQHRVGGQSVVLKAEGETIHLVLVMTVTTEPDERRNIRVQLFPADESNGGESVLPAAVSENDSTIDGATAPEHLLPADVTLSLFIPEQTEPLQSVKSGLLDNYIQLPPFRCPVGEPFSICVRKDGAGNDGAMIQQDFVS